jgi:murein L,D-transpeptidase YcbB/YkuD
MRARSYVAILVAAGVSVVSALLVVLSLAGDDPSRDEIGLQTSVVLEINDNPAASPGESEQPGETVTAALPTGSDPTATPSTSPPSTSHLSTGTGPIEQISEPAPAAEAAPSDETPIADEALLAAINEKLGSEELSKRTNADDLAALRSFYSGRKEPVLWITETGLSARAQAVIGEMGKTDEWGLESAAFDLPQTGVPPVTASDRADAEIKLDLAVLQYARFARGGRAVPNDLSDIFDQKPVARDPQTVIYDIATAAEPGAYLRSLHPKHEQFQRLQKALVTARAAEPAKPDDVKRLVVNMERWRWLPEDLGPTHVWLNIPEFAVHVIKDGKDIHTEKIIVGKPVYATPVFSANMETIVFNPEWTVPPTIIKEDLLPKLRRKPGLFESNTANLEILRVQKLKVRYKDRFVDPARVDWNKVNMKLITFVQPPGADNALGKVKFLYPNEHAVYMHDTIKRGLFKNTVRAEGHHCPRVANPDKFAEVLLNEDKGWGADKIKELMSKGRDEKVTLDHPVPVHTAYFTAVVDDQGKVMTFTDVYKLDPIVAKAIIGKDGTPQAVAGNTQIKQKPGGNVANSTP